MTKTRQYTDAKTDAMEFTYSYVQYIHYWHSPPSDKYRKVSDFERYLIKVANIWDGGQGWNPWIQSLEIPGRVVTTAHHPSL